MVGANVLTNYHELMIVVGTVVGAFAAKYISTIAFSKAKSESR